MHYACNAGHVGVVEALIDFGKNTDIEARTAMNRTPLHLACARGWMDVMSVLLKVGADINAQDNDLETPVHLASANGHVDILYLLVSRDNIDLKIKNRFGKTPAEMA